MDYKKSRAKLTNLLFAYKTLAEIKEGLAKAKGYESFNEMVDIGFGVGLTEILDLCDEAAELYAIQFIKKEVVSSDVEQAAKSHWGECATRVENEAMVLGFKLGAKWQSTQQPATINFFSDEEIEKLFPGTDNVSVAKRIGAKRFQSKLKERVNCVDPNALLKWFCKKYNLFQDHSEHTFNESIQRDINEFKTKNHERE